MPHLLRAISSTARALRAVTLGVLLVGLLGGMLVVSPGAATPASAATSVSLTTAEADHLRMLNDYRRSKGLAPLAVDARVQADAREWARRLGDARTVAHDPDLRADCEAASPTCSGWAENVGSAGSHERVFELFVGSAGHERNLRLTSGGGEDPYRVGIGVYRSGGQTFVVHRFVRCDCRNDELASWLNGARRADLAFAQGLYSDFLGRSAGAAELDSIAAPLAYGVPRRQMVVGLAFSDAWVGAMVDRFYQATLGRDADADGKRFWMEAIRGGRTPAEVAAYFFASDEYYARSGGTDRDWVGALYGALLGRRPDGSGLDHWVAVVRGSSREQVAASFYQSVESRRRRIRALYDLLLGRAPDGDGLAHWTGELLDGHDVRLAIELASSDEYVQRAIARFG